MVLFEFDREGLDIVEKKNNDDYEFDIKIKNVNHFLQAIHEVRAFFENNKIYTEVLFYSHPDHRYQVIVRKDHYIDFLVSLFKHRLLKQIKWID